MSIRTLTLLASASILAGCTNLNDPMSSSEGQFAIINFDEQVDDATAVKGAPTLDADQSDAAIADYKAGDSSDSDSDSVVLGFTPISTD